MQTRQRRTKATFKPATGGDAAAQWAAHLDRLASRRPTAASFGTASAAGWETKAAKVNRKPKG